MQSSIPKRVMVSIRHQGLWATVLQSRDQIEDYLFDIRYGLDTCGRAQLDELTIDSDNKERGFCYSATKVRALRKMFNTLRSMIPADSVMVDFGCGKGRVMLVASEFGFREARGVEFAHELCEIARKNIAIYEAKTGFGTKYRITESDVTNYAINTDESVFFFFNPFDDMVMTKVFSNIAASLQAHHRRVLVIYYNPRYRSAIEQRGDFPKLREFNFWGHNFALYSNRD